MRKRLRRDEGQVLGIALAFLTFVALVLAATLTAATANLHVSQSLAQQRDERYAAEAGIVAAAKQIQGDTTLGNDPLQKDCGFHPGVDFVVNGIKQIDVTCAPYAGSGIGSGAANRPDYSVLALTQAAGCTSQPSGPQCNEGVIDLTCGAFGCQSTQSAGGPGTEVFGRVGSSGVCVYQPGCDPIVDISKADPNPAPSPQPGPGHPAAVCAVNGVIFSPGTYNDPPSIPPGCSKPWWFQPGVYYFDFTSNGGPHVWTIDNNTVVGGSLPFNRWHPTAAGPGPTLPGACTTDRGLPPNAGVQFVFGGDSQLQVSPTGRLELCASASPSQQEVAIYGLKAGGGSPSTFGKWMDPSPNNTGNTPYQQPRRASDPDDGNLAQASIPANSSAALSFNLPGTALPAGTIVRNAKLEIAHYEDPGLALSMTFPNGNGNGSTQSISVPPCPPASPCTNVGATENEYTVDVTSQLMHDPTLLSGLNMTLTATAPTAGGPYSSSVDGVELDLTLESAPGGYRALSGCTQITDGPATSPSQPCPMLSAEPGAALYIQGTVYAPTGGVEVAVQPTNPTDPVRFNRGVIARTVVFSRTQPGSGPAQAPTAGGSFDRWVTLNAYVNGRLRIATSVSFGDVQALLPGPSPPKITYNNWDVK